MIKTASHLATVDVVIDVNFDVILTRGTVTQNVPNRLTSAWKRC